MIASACRFGLSSGTSLQETSAEIHSPTARLGPIFRLDSNKNWDLILPTKICQHIHMALTSEHLNLTSQETHQTGIQQKKQSGT